MFQAFASANEKWCVKQWIGDGSEAKRNKVVEDYACENKYGNQIKPDYDNRESKPILNLSLPLKLQTQPRKKSVIEEQSVH